MKVGKDWLSGPATRTLFLRALAFGLGAILLYSGVSKVSNPYAFLSAVYGYELVGPAVGEWIAFLLPWLEVVVGFCVVARLWEFGASILASILFAVFGLVQAHAYFSDLKIPCGCMLPTDLSRPITGTDVLVSASLLAASLPVLVSQLLPRGSSQRAHGAEIGGQP